MQDEEARSNCQSLFGIERIPTDNCIRDLLDGCPSEAFDALFPACLDTLAEHGARAPFLRLDGRLLLALDGIEFHKSEWVAYCLLHSSLLFEGNRSSGRWDAGEGSLSGWWGGDEKKLPKPLLYEFRNEPFSGFRNEP